MGRRRGRWRWGGGGGVLGGGGRSGSGSRGGGDWVMRYEFMIWVFWFWVLGDLLLGWKRVYLWGGGVKAVLYVCMTWTGKCSGVLAALCWVG